MQPYKMNIYKAVTLLCLLVPYAIIGQNNLAQSIWKQYPDCVDLDTKIYLPTQDTCVQLEGLSGIAIALTEKDELIIENQGFLPIKTSVYNVTKGISGHCESVYQTTEGYEMSPRRLAQSYKTAHYKCLENKPEKPLENISQIIQGMYETCDSTYYVIDQNELIMCTVQNDEYRISRGQYMVQNDVLKAVLNRVYQFNKTHKKLTVYEDQVEKYFEVDICYLMSDCIVHHTTTILSKTCWRKIPGQPMVEEALALIRRN